MTPNEARATLAEILREAGADISFGLFQQTVKYADEGDHTDSPENIALIKRLYFDPIHACDVAARKYLYWRHDPDVPPLTAWVAYNSPGFYHTPEESPNVENYRRALLEAMAILDAQPEETAVPAYNLTRPIDTQQHDWDCAEQSANWGITAAGRHPSDAWLEQQMLADGIESRDVGLLDASGAQLAAWITRQYAEPGANGAPAVRAHNVASVSFDDVRSIAGTCPVLIGGRGWGSAGHWTGVRGSDGERLVLANPGGSGPVYGQQTLDRQQFNARGPWSMVVIQAEGTAGAVPVPPQPPAPADPRDALIAQLRAELAEARSALGVASVDYANGLADIVAALRKLKPAS